MIRVKSGTDPTNEMIGESWNTATNLRRALAQSLAGDQIWIEVGIYIPIRVKVLLREHHGINFGSKVEFVFMEDSWVRNRPFLKEI